MNKRNRSWKRILVFLLMVSMLLPMFAPVSAEAAEELYLAYQTDASGNLVVNFATDWEKEDYRVDSLLMNVGDEVDFCFINATNWTRPEWTSSNTKVVKVDQNGVVTAVGEGTAQVTLTYSKKLTGRKISASAMIYVGESNWNLKIGTQSALPEKEEYRLKVGTDVLMNIYGISGLEHRNIYSCEWKSSDKKVAEVIGDTLYARKAGEAEIDLKIVNRITGWQVEKRIIVHVTDPEMTFSAEWDNPYYLLYGEDYKRLFSTGFLHVSSEIENDILDDAWEVVRGEINTIGISAFNELSDLANGLTIAFESLLNGWNYKVEDGHREAIWYLVQEMLTEDNFNRQYLAGAEEALAKAKGVLELYSKPEELTDAIKMIQEAGICIEESEFTSIVDYVTKDEAGDVAALLSEGLTISEYLVTALYMYELDTEFLNELQKCSSPGEALYDDIELIKKDKAKDPIKFFTKRYVTETFAKSLGKILVKLAGKEATALFDAVHEVVWMFSDMAGVSELSKVTKATYLMEYVYVLSSRITQLRIDITENFASYSEEELIAKIGEYEFAYNTFLSMVPPVLEAVEELGQYGYDMEVSADASIVTGGYDYDRHIAMAMNLYLSTVEDEKEKTEVTVQEKLKLLLKRLNAFDSQDVAYFTVNREPCGDNFVFGHTNCANCKVSNIITSGWFKNIFGEGMKVSNLPMNDVDANNRNYNGYSCFGFACFAQWYIYADDISENVIGKRVASITFNKEDIMGNVQPGDVLRCVGINNAGNKVGHSMVVYDVQEDGIVVVDCNGDSRDQKNCRVKAQFISYNSSYYADVPTFVNRVTKTEELGEGKAGWFDVVAGDIPQEELEVSKVSEPVYQKGSRGTAVERLQKNLTFLGFSTGGVDGAFGGKTETAVKQLQEKLHVEVNGKVDSGLNQQIQKMVKEVQTYLSKKGYYSSTIDGITGSGTEKGLKKLQKEMGVSQTGTITSDVIEYMLGDGKVSVKFDAIIQLAEPTITPSVTPPITPSITPSVTPEITPTITETPEPPKEEKKTYTVTFNSNGGSVVASKTVEEGTVLSSFTTPSKEKHTFDGWMYGGKIVTNVTVTKDMTLTASWTPYKTMYVYYHYTTDAEVKGSDGKTMNPYTVCAYWGGTNWIDKSTNKYVSASKIYREELWLDEPLTASGTGFYHTKSSSCASYGCEEESFKNANAYRDRNYATNGRVWYNQKTISVPASTEEGVRK